MANKKIRLKMSNPNSDSAYVALPGYPKEPVFGTVSRTICLDEVIENFKGPRINLDFDKEGVLIGIEILV